MNEQRLPGFYHLIQEAVEVGTELRGGEGHRRTLGARGPYVKRGRRLGTIAGGVSFALLLLSCAALEPGKGDTAHGDSAMPSNDAFTLSASEPLSCDSPVTNVSYTDAAAAWGLHGMTVPLTSGRSDGGGVAVDDLDGDGDLDVVLTYQGEEAIWIFLRDGDQFTGESVPAIDPYLPSLADVDGDGQRDLLLGSSKPAIYLNVGGVLNEPIVLTEMARGEVRELAAADLDGDGDVDFFGTTSSRSEDDLSDSQDLLFWNDGGAFTIEPLPNPQAAAKSYDAVVFDADQDGDPDVYEANDAFGDWPGNSYYRNDAGVLVDAGEACTCALRFPAMGATSGDYNADGWPDLYAAGEGRNYLLAGGADGTFVDVTQVLDADPTTSNFQMAWGGIFYDHDNDGYQDLAVASGDFAGWEAKGVGEQALNLLRQTEGGFVDVSEAAGLPTSTYRALVTADFNHDGVLDLLATHLEETPRLFLSDGCTAAGWFSVTAPVGSAIEIEAGGRTQYGAASTESGYGAAQPPTVWFGLGDAQVVDRLTVRSPWGGETGVWTGLPARVAVVVEVR